MTPAADLAGINVFVKAEIKVGSAWKAAKTGSATVSATGLYSLDLQARQEGYVPHDGLDHGDRRLQGLEVPDQALQGQVTN